MKADFSGYATKYGLKCSDGRTILPEAFKHQDTTRVPLVWQHGHSDPENVLGHCILEHRDDGVYAYGFFNNSSKAENTRTLVEHRDVDSLSIYANQLIERVSKVIHGAIREVSIVLAGANPGARIDNVTLRHDGFDTVLEDEAIIQMGLPLELSHSDDPDDKDSEDDADDDTPDEEISHADTPTIQDVYESLTDIQKEVVHFMLGEAAGTSGDTMGHADVSDDQTIQDVYNSFTDIQKEVVHYMLGEAVAAAGTNDNSAAHGEIKEGSDQMGKNVFESASETAPKTEVTLSHDDMKAIVTSAARSGSLKDAVQDYALQHGIENIDILFPEARNITAMPEWNKRRTEWVSRVLDGAGKTPFSRVKTVIADITADEARAKGYVKGTLKKEEWFGLTKRTTSPTTVYKKQALDRDDMVDITDFDVVVWLKGEMRLMLEEELARAILVGDGREVGDEDKIKDPMGASSGDGIRSIMNDHELFATTLTVNVDDANSSADEIVDAVLDGMEFYKGSGTPTLYCPLRTLNSFLKAKDTQGRRLYLTRSEVATALNVSDVVVVEVMNDLTDLVGIIVNLGDYNVGADKGGEVNLFDDFDIDYNKYKYLIETRMSGALTKIKSALVIKKTASTNVLVKATTPSFNKNTGALTIPTKTGVVYKNAAGVTITTAGSPYTVAPGTDYVVNATPTTGYYFADNATDSWTFTADPA